MTDDKSIVAELKLEVAELRQRLARSEDIEAIRRLKAHYADLCDEGYDANKLVALFTDDGQWDGGKLGCFSGRDALHTFFSDMPQTMSFAIHHLTNSAITVNADRSSATARWYLLQTATLQADGNAVWLAARYDDDLVRTDGNWRFKCMRIQTRFFSSHAKGWSAERFLVGQS